MRLLATLTLLLALALPAAASASAPPARIIVRFAGSQDARVRGEARSAADVHRSKVLPLAGMEVVAPERGVSVAEAVRGLEREPGVLYAEPDVPRRALATPDDPLFPQQWALTTIGAPTAWSTTTGSASVVTAVIDSGLEPTHPDLAQNAWTNPREVAGNGVDDDANGFVDDVRGWDFVQRDATPTDGNGHGTHVAGTIAARGNNRTGVSGVAWTGALMAVRVLDDAGAGSASDAIRGYAYARRNGARIVNLSLGGTDSSQAERDAIAAAPDVLFVTAAGNDGEDDDVVGSFPCNYDLPNVLCVGASDRGDALAPFSNHGARTVDLAAPGVGIASTYPTNLACGSRPSGGYCSLSGTSMATPHVAGVAALLLSAAPGLTVAQLRAALLAGVQDVPALHCLTVTGGRLDAAASVRIAQQLAAGDAAPPVPSPAGCPAPGTASAGSAAGPASTDPGATTPPPSPAPTATPSAPEAVVPAAVAPVAPTAPGPVAPPPDTTAPGVGLIATRVLRTATLRATGLRATLSCSEACALGVTLTLDPATAKRFGLRSRRLAAAGTSLAAAGREVLVLRTRTAARKRLRGAGRATLRVGATDAAGNRRVRTLTVTLRA